MNTSRSFPGSVVGLAMMTVTMVCADGGDPAAALTSKGPDPNLAARLFQIPAGVELDQNQKLEVAALVEEYEPKLARFQVQILDLLTKEQREARAASFSRSRTDAGNGREIRDASIAGIDLSKAQRERFTAIREEKSRLKREALQRFHAVLTAEQRTVIAAAKGSRKKRTDARSLNQVDGQFLDDSEAELCVAMFEGAPPLPTLAVWTDGVFLKWPSPQQREDFALVGRFDKAELGAALAEIGTSAFFSIQREGYAVPDAAWAEIYVSHGGQSQKAFWHQVLNPGFGGDINTDSDYRDFVKNWLEVKANLEKLCPTEIHRTMNRVEFDGKKSFRKVDLKSPRKTSWPQE